jgi:dUTP pyrophosphatase
MVILEYFKNSADVPTPRRANETDAGLDLFLPEDLEILPWNSAVVDSGIYIRPYTTRPNYYTYTEVKSKSGLGFKNRILAFPGVVDETYNQQTIKVLLFNMSPDKFFRPAGQSFVQLIVFELPKISLVENLNLLTEGGNRDGFGSTDTLL